MSDLISRQAAIKYLVCNMAWYDEDGHEADEDEKRKCIEELINGVPSAEPEPQPGKWIVHDELRNVYGGKVIECPVCGEKYIVQYITDEKFCRNCGADMRGEGK